jgi:hypothetical protein
MNPKSIMLCPKCASTDVVNDLSTTMVAWGGSTRYMCNSCGHSAIVFPVVEDSDLEATKEFIKESPGELKEVKRVVRSKGIQSVGINKFLISWELVAIGIAGVAALSLPDKTQSIIYLGFLGLICGVVFLAKKVSSKK